MAKQNPQSKNTFNDPRSKHNTPDQNKKRQQEFEAAANTDDYDNENRGALFVNQRKETENHPTLAGMINISGVEYWLSAWSKIDSEKKKYLSIAATDKENDSVHYNGKLLVNETKKDKNHPDMRGYLLMDGDKVSIAGWYQKDKKKQTYLSLAISENGNMDANTEEMPWDF